MLSVKHYLHTCDAMDSSGSTLPTSCIACIWKTAGYQCSLRNFPLANVMYTCCHQLANWPEWTNPSVATAHAGGLGTGIWQEVWLMLAVMEEGAKAGKEPLGRVVINLADFASDDGPCSAGRRGPKPRYQSAVYGGYFLALSRGHKQRQPCKRRTGPEWQAPSYCSCAGAQHQQCVADKDRLAHGRDSMF